MQQELLDRILEINFPAPVRPWRFGKDAAESALSVIKGSIMLHSGAICPILPEINWSMQWERNNFTHRLYLMSLHYVGEVILMYEATGSRSYLEAAMRIINAFLEKYSVQSPDLLLLTSSDHAHYVRTFVLLEALKLLKTVPNSSGLCGQIIEALISHMRWMHIDENSSSNNHRTMCDLGILAGYVKLKPIGKEAEEWMNRALERLIESISSSFDEDGMNNENTISYQLYNISLFDAALKFCVQQELGARFVDMARPVISKATTAARHMLWQNGWVPPIGDCGVSKSRLISLNESKWFKTGNFVVIKDEKLYFSLRCGFSAPAHKHVDETSITLRYAGRDILVDSGSFNYALTDPFRKYFESASAHCGIYPAFLKEVPVADYISNYHSSSRIMYVEKVGNRYSIGCEYSLKMNGVSVTRKLIVDMDEKCVTIEDEFQSDRPEVFR